MMMHSMYSTRQWPNHHLPARAKLAKHNRGDRETGKIIRTFTLRNENLITYAYHSLYLSTENHKAKTHYRLKVSLGLRFRIQKV